MIGTLETLLLERWTELLPGVRRPERVRTAVLSSSRDPRGSRIVLVFAAGNPTPVLVGKVSRRPDAAAALEREWGRLRALQESLPAELRSTVPAPVFNTVLHGAPIFLQTAMPGQNLKTLLQRGGEREIGRRPEQDLARFEQWLKPFQSAVPTQPTGAEPIPRVRPMTKAVVRALPGLEAEGLVDGRQGQQVLERLRRLEAALQERPPCWVHGDLWPGNVMIDGSSWRIIDWDELSIGLAWQDRFWFAIQYGALVHTRLLGHSDLQEGMRRTLFTDHPVSTAVAIHLRRAVLGWGLEARSAADLVQGLLIQAAGGVEDEERRTWFNRAAPALLREWLERPEQVQL